MISPGSAPGGGSVVRYSAAALTAEPQESTAAAAQASGAASAPATAATSDIEATAQPAGRSSNALPAMAGGVTAAFAAAAVWFLVKGRRRKAGLAAGANQAG